MIKKTIIPALLIMFLLMTVSLWAAAPNAPTELKTEYIVNPIGIDTATPRFSWICTDSDRGSLQTAYQIIVASTAANINSNIGDKWDSGKVASSNQNGIQFAGTALVKRTGYYWKVRVWDNDGNVSSFSATATFETGMLSASDWTAQWIGGDYNLLRDDLVLTAGKTVSKARLYVTSLGYNEVYINGQKAGDGVCNPAYTRYERRALYSTYDVTSMMQTNNGIGIMLGDAYYKRFVGSNNLAARLELWVTYTDGTTTYFGTHSTTFKATKGGPITYNDIWNGERYDARQEASIAGWSSYGFNDSAWATPTVISYSGAIAAQLQPVKVTEDINPVSINQSPNPCPSGYTWCAFENETISLPGTCDVAYGANGSFNYKYGVSGSITFNNATFGDPIANTVKAGYYKNSTSVPSTAYVLDMGVNMVGWVRLTVNGSAGTKVRLRFAENKKADGSLETTDLRSAQATDTYTLKGSGTEVWEPRFTHHGFRYVEILGYPGTPTLSSIKGRVIHSNYPMESSFTCSNALINNIYNMYKRSQRSNTVSIPTDCPQRDERQGWGGDAVVTSEAACLSFDMLTFYEKWFNDIDDCEGSTGGIPDVNPDYYAGNYSDTAWMSTRVLIPWDLYMATGDKDFLSKHYSKMKLYISYLQSVAGGDYLGTPAGYGDWVPAGATEPSQFFADAYYYQNVNVMAKIAGVLGNSGDQTTYTTLATNIKNAFNNSYFKNNSYYGNNTQAGNAVALSFDMVPADYKTAVLNSLVTKIETNGNLITTGILGSKAIMEALWLGNRSDKAFTLMNQTAYPSWGYMYNKGPGTIWERWNSDTAIGSGMNSYNHVMYGGGPAAWVYKGLAGISPLQPGYAQVLIRPEIVGDVTNVNASVKTPRGLVSVNWTKVSGAQLNLNVTIPVNCKAVVQVPTLGKNNVAITESGVQIWNNGLTANSVTGVSINSSSSTAIGFNVGSGSYSFVMTTNGSGSNGPNGYTWCANENGSYTLSGTCNVAYGANGSFKYKNGVTGTITFDSNSFGGDPIYGVVKAGYYQTAGSNPTGPAGYVWCANEDASYTLSGTCDVAYGVNGNFYYLTGRTGSITFNNATFGGDPCFGVAKYGFYKSTGTATPTPTPTITPGVTPTATKTPTTTPVSFNDNFNDNVIGSAWSFYGSGAWSESGGILRQDSTSQGDPCKAIISNSGKNFGSNHTILAKVYVDAWTDGDSARAGVSLFTGTGDGKGYSLLFHNNHSTVQFLDDGAAWSSSFTFNWTNRTWYWFKLQMSNGTLNGKIWQDGAAEPGSWQFTWVRSGRSGYPALNGGTSGHGGSCVVFFDDVTVSVP